MSSSGCSLPLLGPHLKTVLLWNENWICLKRTTCLSTDEDEHKCSYRGAQNELKKRSQTAFMRLYMLLTRPRSHCCATHGALVTLVTGWIWLLFRMKPHQRAEGRGAKRDARYKDMPANKMTDKMNDMLKEKIYCSTLPLNASKTRLQPCMDLKLRSSQANCLVSKLNCVFYFLLFI